MITGSEFAKTQLDIKETSISKNDLFGVWAFIFLDLTDDLFVND